MSAIPHHTSDPVCALCEQKLTQADPILADWFRTHVKPNFKDAHISWTFRDQVSQEQAFNDGKSKLHFPFSEHNKNPSQAIDLFEINEKGQAEWELSFFAAIDSYNRMNKIPLFWGHDFKTLVDSDHWQIKDPSQA